MSIPATPIISYRPTGWFWRKAIREEEDINTLRSFAMGLVLEIEIHKRFIREMGEVPPKAVTTAEESKWLGRQCSDIPLAESLDMEDPLRMASGKKT